MKPWTREQVIYAYHWLERRDRNRLADRYTAFMFCFGIVLIIDSFV